jgi:hypothetical protein
MEANGVATAARAAFDKNDLLEFDMNVVLIFQLIMSRNYSGPELPGTVF